MEDMGGRANRARRDAEGIAAEKEELEMRCGALQDQDMKKSKQLREVQRTITGQLEEIDRLSKLVDAGREEGDAERDIDYIFEPSPEALLDTLVPRHVNFQVWRALLEVNAGFLQLR